LANLAEIDPLFRQWRRDGNRSQSKVPAFITLPTDIEELLTWVAENAEFRAVNGRKQKAGYRVSARTPDGKPLHASFWLYALDGGMPGWLGNRLSITLFAENGHEAGLAPLARPALLALATGFDCDWAATEAAHYITPAGSRAGAEMVRYESGGMVYLAASAAAQITVPTDIDIEYLPNGALLMTAGAPFDRKNAQHLAAAYRIQLALEPLNTAPRKSGEN
jgi:hypothetical protein